MFGLRQYSQHVPQLTGTFRVGATDTIDSGRGCLRTDSIMPISSSSSSLVVLGTPFRFPFVFRGDFLVCGGALAY